MPVNRIKEFLDGQKVKYVAINHSPAYTAQEIAALSHVRGKDLAKTVMVKLDDKLAMAVLPASAEGRFERATAAACGKQAELASEKEFKDMFPH